VLSPSLSFSRIILALDQTRLRRDRSCPVVKSSGDSYLLVSQVKLCKR